MVCVHNQKLWIIMYRSILKMSVVSLVFLGSITMGSDYNNALIIPEPDRIKNLAPETKEYLIDHLDNPITFGQTNKENHGLVKYQGLRNICLTFQKDDPSFVLSHYVPILLVDYSDKRDSYRFSWCIDSYKFVMMPNGFYFKDDIIIALRNKRLNQALEQKKVRYGQDKVKLWFDDGIHTDPLTIATLFGDDEDISNELTALYNNEHFWLYGDGGAIYRSLRTIIHHFDIHNNNALEMLLSAQKQMQQFPADVNSSFSYCLLFAADKTKNKKAFSVLIAKDPFDAKSTIWADSRKQYNIQGVLIKPGEPRTTLDRMIEDGGFDPEYIALARQHGFKTKEELLVEEQTRIIEEQRQRRESQKDKECTLF